MELEEYVEDLGFREELQGEKNLSDIFWSWTWALSSWGLDTSHEGRSTTRKAVLPLTTSMVGEKQEDYAFASDGWWWGVMKVKALDGGQQNYQRYKFQLQVLNWTLFELQLNLTTSSKSASCTYIPLNFWAWKIHISHCETQIRCISPLFWY